MLAEKDSYTNQAYQRLQVISQDKEKQFEYEAREKAIWDHNHLMYEAEKRGIEKEAIRIAKDLLLLKVSDEIILKSTKLTVEQLQLLKNEKN